MRWERRSGPLTRSEYNGNFPAPSSHLDRRDCGGDALAVHVVLVVLWGRTRFAQRVAF